MICDRCGETIPDGNGVCPKCGANQVGAGKDQAATSALTVVEIEGTEELEIVHPPETVPEGKAVLVIKKGPESGARFILEKPVTTIGRHPQSEIFLDDITVSRRHAEIRRAEAGFEIIDSGSLNGTYLNRERIEQAQLSNGDEIQIGKFRMLFFAG
jgi:pSer/pThr/pTyr-binding forkhead associated (FHA) protein